MDGVFILNVTLNKIHQIQTSDQCISNVCSSDGTFLFFPLLSFSSSLPNSLFFQKRTLHTPRKRREYLHKGR